MMMMECRKSAVLPWASVSLPSSNTWRNRFHMLGFDFSISSRSITVNGCFLTWLVNSPSSATISGVPRILSEEFGDWNSLMSSRIIRSDEPKTKSARALTISVFPVPVGPAKRKTPVGRVGSHKPALIIATLSPRQSMASGWPRMRFVNRSLRLSRLRCSRSSRMLFGRPVMCDRVIMKSSEVRSNEGLSQANPRLVNFNSPRRIPGAA